MAAPATSSMHDALVAEIHEFWFGALRAGFPVEDRQSRWFGGSTGVDAEIRARFGGATEAAIDGGLEHWRTTARGAVALVLLLDQFARNIHRGSARAFAGDARARSIARAVLAEPLQTVERVFMLLPFEHSELLADQEFCVAEYDRLLETVYEAHRATIAGYRRFAAEHREIIARFGRFPHRNRALGRADTAEEAAWLGAGGRRFGQ